MTIHTVRPGETLSSISHHYRCSTSDLQALNHLRNPDYIRAGQTLHIPPMRAPANAPVSPAPATRAPGSTQPQRVLPVNGAHDIWDDLDDIVTQAVRLGDSLLDSIANTFRGAEAKESVQQRGAVPLTPASPNGGTPVATPKKAAHDHKSSHTSRKHAEIVALFKERYNKEPHVVVANGTKLTPNERKQIMAAVALCEMNDDGFGSSNTDKEFQGKNKKFSRGGIETGYSRIVHIGLSYGMIQFTQDSGNLGKLLVRMYEKNSVAFKQIFPNFNVLVQLTNSGHPDYPNLPKSGLDYWGRIKETEDGRERHKLANQDLDHNRLPDLPPSRVIRGRRVQPIPYLPGGDAKDIWTGEWLAHFIQAADIPEFQEAQIELAVEDFFNPILSKAQANRVRSAWGLAFMAACAVRGGPQSKLVKLFIRVAKTLGLTVPFSSTRDELTCLQAIAQAKLVPGSKKGEKLAVVEGPEGEVSFSPDERRRARVLLNDELKFLTEDFYDLSTYS